MIRIAFTASLLLFSACSPAHKDLPNEPPVIEAALRLYNNGRPARHRFRGGNLSGISRW